MSNKIIDKLSKRLDRTKLKLSKIIDYQNSTLDSAKIRNPDIKCIEDLFNYHGGWDVGYYQGIIRTLEDMIDIIEDEYDNQQ